MQFNKMAVTFIGNQKYMIVFAKGVLVKGGATQTEFEGMKILRPFYDLGIKCLFFPIGYRKNQGEMWIDQPEK